MSDLRQHLSGFESEDRGHNGVVTAERRRHERFPVEGDAEVLVSGGSRVFHGRVQDISLSGCFIETSARLRMEIGSPVEMVFRANGVMLRLSANVRVVRFGAGAGFLFEELNPHIREELERLIETLKRS
ncbi:MAG TPA: PilZ domain-containing protein, partial [Edaphobacter sp.]